MDAAELIIRRSWVESSANRVLRDHSVGTSHNWEAIKTSDGLSPHPGGVILLVATETRMLWIDELFLVWAIAQNFFTY
jgi:hypothetical protein